MSDQPDKHEKIHDPTPQRIKKAREEGNVFKSKELVSAGILVVGGLMLYYGSPHLFEAMRQMSARSYLGAASTNVTIESTPVIFLEVAMHLAWVLLPFFGLLMIVGAGLSVVQTGINITAKPLAPKANRISPKQGLQRIFSSKGLFEAFKAIAKVAIVAPIAFFTIRRLLPEILQLHMMPLEAALSAAAWWIVLLIGQMLMALLFLSILDFSFEKWKYHQDLKMTDKELKDEQKQQEGDPLIRGKRRQVAQDLARRPRFDHAVMKSDVVVTNPTHYAVALRYDVTEAEAPRVMIKGIRKQALRIKHFALEHDIPVVEDRPLARALYDTVPEGQEIPNELYTAVATILAEIYRQRGKF